MKKIVKKIAKNRKVVKSHNHILDFDHFLDAILVIAIILGVACTINKVFFGFSVPFVKIPVCFFSIGIICLDFGRTFFRKGPFNFLKYHSLDFVILGSFMILFSAVLYPATGRIYYLINHKHKRRKK